MAGGGGGGGMNWEIGIDMYTLICIKWITNKNLLYKKINKIKFKNSKKKKKQLLLYHIFQKLHKATYCLLKKIGISYSSNKSPQ